MSGWAAPSFGWTPARTAPTPRLSRDAEAAAIDAYIAAGRATRLPSAFAAPSPQSDTPAPPPAAAIPGRRRKVRRMTFSAAAARLRAAGHTVHQRGRMLDGVPVSLDVLLDAAEALAKVPPP